MESEDRDLVSIVRSLLQPPRVWLLDDNQEEFVRFLADRLDAGEPITQAQRLALYDVRSTISPGWVSAPHSDESGIQDDRHLDRPEDYWELDEDDE